MKLLLQAKRILKEPVFYLLLLCMIGSCLLLSRFSSVDNETVRVGIYLEDSTAYPGEYASIRTLFTEYQGTFSFCLEPSVEALQQQVIMNEYECGYVIPSDLFESLANKQMRNLVDLYVNQNTTLSLLSNEVVFSILFDEYAFQILRNYLAQDPLLAAEDPDEIDSTARELYLSYLSGESTFNFDYEYLGEDLNTDLNADTGSATMLNGFIAIFVMIAGFIGAYRYLHDRELHVFDRMPVHRLFWHRVTYLFLYLLPFFLCGILLNPQNALHQCFYMILVLLVMLALMGFIRSRTTLIAILPVYLLGSLVFTPVFIDLSSYLSIGKLLQYCFLPYYLQIM